MIGMVQMLAELIAIYMAYRGITDALRDFSEAQQRTRLGATLRIIAAIIALLLVPVALLQAQAINQFAAHIGVKE